jgi:hypothetical protein
MDSLSVAPREKALTFARCLRAGDLVQMRADRLGSMSNAIIADRLTPDVPPSTISQ